MRKDLIKDDLGAGKLRLGRLALVIAAHPELVRLGEAGLEAEVGEQRRKLRLAGARVARADRDSLAQKLLHRGREGAIPR